MKRSCRLFPHKALIGITLTALFIIFICIKLGIWQLERLRWKEELLFNLNSSRFIPHENFVNMIRDPHMASALEFKKVRLKGLFRHELEMQVIPRTFKGQSGAHLITPFVLLSGEVILVNRGWIPQLKDQPIPIYRSQEPVELIGVIRRADLKGLLTPAYDSRQGLWFAVNLKEMPQFIAKTDQNLAKHILPLYVMQQPIKDFQDYPKPVDLISSLPNHHFQYALTWFLLAFGLGVSYISYVYCYWRKRQ